MSNSVATALVAAGGPAALVRCLCDQRLSTDASDRAAGCMGLLAGWGVDTSKAIADAGGPCALIEALAKRSSPEAKVSVAEALINLVLLGQAEAVAAADPTHAATAALEQLSNSPRFFGHPHQRLLLAAAQQQLAEARRKLPAASAAAAPTGRAAPSPVCAATGCSATSDLKRCTACSSVRYCSKPCQRAHWQEHRPGCKLLQAAAAAAAAADDAAGGCEAAARAGPSGSARGS